MFELRNTNVNQPKIPNNKKIIMNQRPFSAQGPKLNQQNFGTNLAKAKYNNFSEENLVNLEFQNNPYAAGVGGGGKSNRIRTAGPNRGISKEDLLNSKEVTEPNEDDMLYIPKEINTNAFALQDFQKFIPKNTPIEKEKLYEETLHLKNSVNKLKDENMKLKTRNLVLEREVTKWKKVVEKAGQAQISPGNGTIANDSSLILNLKKQNKELRDELKVKIDEIEIYKRNTKVTKFQELETELKTFLDENSRLKALLDHHIRTSSKIKVEEYNALEMKYYMQSNLLENLQKDILQLKQNIKFLEEENNTLKNLKERDDKIAKKNVNENNKLKKKLKETEQEVQRLVLYYKNNNNNNNPTNKNPQQNINQSSPNNKSNHQDEQENLKKQLQEKENKLEELENLIKDMKKATPEKDKYTKLQDKYDQIAKDYQNLTEKYNSLESEKQQLELQNQNLNANLQKNNMKSSNPNNQNVNKNMKSNTNTNNGDNDDIEDYQLDNKKNSKKAHESGLKSKKIGKRITYEDIKDIGYELTLIFRLKQIPYDELESKLFDEKNSRTPVSVEDLKIILLSDPFELNDITNAYLAARFLFEYGDDKFNSNDPNLVKELGLLKDNFKILVGEYTLITEDIEKDLFDSIAATIARYEESIRANFEARYNNTETITHHKLIEIFNNLEIDIDDEQMDYLILRLYDFSHNLNELEYNKIFDIFQTEDNVRLKQIFDIYNENMNNLHEIKETDSDERERIKTEKKKKNNQHKSRSEDYDVKDYQQEQKQQQKQKYKDYNNNNESYEKYEQKSPNKKSNSNSNQRRTEVEEDYDYIEDDNNNNNDNHIQERKNTQNNENNKMNEDEDIEYLQNVDEDIDMMEQVDDDYA